MGPDEISLSLADTILAAHPQIKASRIDLAYTIMGWVEEEERKQREPNDGR